MPGRADLNSDASPTLGPVNVVAVIPARWASVRFPGKPLALLAGKPVIVHVCQQAKKAKHVQSIIVATDDQRIMDVVNAAGFSARLTRADHVNGTSRIAEVAATLDAEIIVNVQGDEPFINKEPLAKVIEVFRNDESKQVDLASLMREIKEEDEINNSLEFDTTKKFTKIKRLRKKKGLIKKKKKGIVKKSDSICSHEFFEDDEGNMTKRSIYDKFDYIELRNVKNFSKIKTDIQKTISEANQEIKKLEKEFFINEHNISITKSRFPDDCIPVNADIRTFNWQVKYYLLLEIS